jgi:hypothetical protein
MEASARLDRLQDDHRAGDFRAAAPIAQELVEKHQLGIAEGSQPFGVLCKRVMEAMGEADEARFRWAQGEIEYRPAMLGVYREFRVWGRRVELRLKEPPHAPPQTACDPG